MSQLRTSPDKPVLQPDSSSPEAESVKKRRLVQLEALYKMGQTVTSSLNLETVFQKVLLQTVRVVRATGASIFLPEADGLVFAAACGKGAEALVNQQVPLDNSVAGVVFQTGKAVVISDAVTSKRVYRVSSQFTGHQVGSLMAVPLRVEKQILGVMEAVHTQQHKFGDDDLRLLETAASWASIAISNARQHADLGQRLQERDEMEMARRAAEAASRAKSEFIANISHEIRTPMNAIVGFSHLALKAGPDTKQQDYLTKIQTSAYTLLGILEDILNFSKLETNRLEIEAAPFQLDKVLNNVSASMAAKAEEKGLEMRLIVAPDVPVALIGDALRLREVLLNLVGNAVKFTDQGNVQISVETVEYQNEVVTLRFIICDTGIGMSDQHIAHLFQPFAQADSSTTREYGGVGLGLAISKRLVDLMGGSLDVTSQPAVGSTFTLAIPFFLQPEPPKHQVTPAILGKLRVLVVDDDAASCMLFENMLQSMKFAVSIVDSGVVGLAELERAIEAGEQPYDLVILDWKAPGMGGLETARQIKTNSRLPQPPAIIITTAHGNQGLLRQVEELKLEGFLVKPLSSSLLLDTIQDIFWRRQPLVPRETLLESQGALHSSFSAGTRVLLVEDNEINRLLVREILEKAGIIVLEAKDGKEAVEIAEKGAAQLNAVLMDVSMPVMNGYEATRRIRRNSACKDLPIIAMTASAMSGDREKSLAAGMNEHITKPVDPQELLRVLVDWIQLPEIKTSETAPALAETIAEPPLPLFPILPGIDTQVGLERADGSCELYRKLLFMFQANHAMDIHKIKASLETGNIQSAIQQAHSLKGAAGAVGMEGLFRIVGALETTLKQEEASREALLVQAEHLLNEALASIASLQTPAQAQGGLSGQLENETGLQAVEPLLIQLRRHLEQHDTEALSVIDVIQKQVHSRTLQDHLGKLQTLLQGYDFNGALEYLNRLSGIER